MKIIRFQISNGLVHYGELRENTIYQIINFSYQQREYVFGEAFPLSQIKIIAPVTPGKVIGLAYNYKDLVGEKERLLVIPLFQV